MDEKGWNLPPCQCRCCQVAQVDWVGSRFSIIYWNEDPADIRLPVRSAGDQHVAAGEYILVRMIAPRAYVDMTLQLRSASVLVTEVKPW